MKQTAIIVKDLILGEGIPKICVPIIGKTKKQLLQEIENMQSEVYDLIEWRVDYFIEQTNLNSILDTMQDVRLALGNTPLLFTFRTKQEGGQSSISKQDYYHLAETAIRSQLIDLIDIELFLGDELAIKIIELAKKHNIVTVLSNHDFQKTPSRDELLCRLSHMNQLNADLPKLAVMPQTAEDVLRLLDVTETFVRKTGRPIITMSMGKLGIISRLCGEVFGSCLTFGTVGNASAPGQIPSQQLKEILHVLHLENK